jgi:hypothetical protein
MSRDAAEYRANKPSKHKRQGANKRAYIREAKRQTELREFQKREAATQLRIKNNERRKLARLSKQYAKENA